MPELPEVEVVRAGLAPAVTGAIIESVEVLDPRSVKRHVGTSETFAGALTGRTIHAAVRRGKFLWLPLGDAAGQPAGQPAALLTHLGMSGQVLLREPGAPNDRSLRIRLIVLHPEHGQLALHFVDQRIFGSMAVDTLLPTPDGLPGGFSGPLPEDSPHLPWVAALPSQVGHIARDPLDPAFDDAAFVAALRSRSSGVKRLLLDQNLVSGIGNIYADESLWAARLHYDTPGTAVSARKARELLAEVRSVLTKALAEGGTSFDAQYLNVNGQAGYFAHSLNAYGQQGKPCPRCGRPIVRESFMNRGSHFCAHCQRLRVVAAR